MSGPKRRGALLSIGAALAVAGQYTLANNEAVAARLEHLFGARGHVFTEALQDLYPRCVALGFGVLLLGTALLALAIGLPSAASAVADVTPQQPFPSVRRSRAIGLMAAVSGLAVLDGLLVTRTAPGRGAIVVWIATIALGLGATLAFDRVRGTPFGNPFPSRWDWTAVLLLVGLDVVLIAHDLTDWHWSGTPDESYFFMFAKALIQGHFDGFALSERGLFGFNPVLSSYYQAAFMKLFGMNVFGWRMSSVAALAVSLPSVYLLGRELWSRRAGLVAAVLLGTGQLPVSFAHLGYNNIHVIPVVTGALGATAWAIRRRSLAGYFVAGCVAGLGFFTYSTAILAAPLAVLLLWSLGRFSRRNAAEIGALALGVVLTALPMLLRAGEFVANIFRLSGFGSSLPDAAPAHGPGWFDVISAKVAHIGAHWMLCVLHAPWFPCPSHFTPKPIVDPITGVLATVGLWLGVGAIICRSGATRFLFVGYLLSAFAVGALTPYPCPALTRLLFVAPFTALLAGVGLDQALRHAVPVARHAVASVIAVALVAAAAVSSTAALHTNVYHRNHGYGDGTTSELLRLMEDLPGNYRIVFIQTHETFMEAVDQVFAAYNAEKRLTYLRPFNPDVKKLLEKLTPPFLVTYDLRKREESEAIEQTLRERFPDVQWQESAPKQSWNLRYFYVPAR